MIVLRRLAILSALAMALTVPGLALAQQSTPPQSTRPAGMSPAEVERIEQVIREYLLRNPEVIIEAVQGLERRQRADAQKQAQAQIAQRKDDLLNDPDSPVAGNPNGDVTLVEFFDYRCPYCKQVAPAIFQLIKEDKKLRLVLKEFPILGPESVAAARAALAARLQGKYLEMHHALMRMRGNFSLEAILKAAEESGIDGARLRIDMESDGVKKQIEKTYELGRALSINGTPAFVIGDRIIPGAVDIETLKTLIRQARQG
ncbi:MAG TPA: DsbA family protein [Alphaproteobacteria bacterium]|nr:DsbA family protein [Alphaproteobacteria bacterium]